MQAGTRAAAVSVLACLLLLGSIRNASPIAVDNDGEVLGSASGGIGFRCPECTLEIIGAPRLLTAVDAASVGNIRVVLDVEGGTPLTLFINVNVYDADTLLPILTSAGTPFKLVGPVCPSPSDKRPDPFCTDLSHGQVYLRQFANFQTLENLLRGIPFSIGDVILTIELSSTVPSNARSKLTLTVSGKAGDEIVVDQLGDTAAPPTPGQVLDIPPRSMPLVEALARLSAGAQRQTGAELDAPGVNRPVGLTHAFNLRSGAKIDRATLTLRVQPGDGGFNNDYVFLDEGVDIIAAQGPRGAPRVFLRDLPDFVPGQASTVKVDLVGVLHDLYDGQLNVIVSDDSVVNFSDLRIFLQDP
jgi:hypothetical protein